MIDYRKLDVYWESRTLARDVFQVTTELPPYLRWRLGGQLDDAIESVGANIAEGAGRKNASHGNVELIRYPHMAYGSACEAEHRVCGLHDRGLISEEAHKDLTERIDKMKAMLWSLIREWKRHDRGKKQDGAA